MSRADLGFAATHALLVAPGLALLYCAGLVTRLRDLPWALGPAYLFGVASVMTTTIVLMVIGLPAKLPQIVAVAALLTAAFAGARLLAARRSVRAAPDVPEPDPGESRAETWAWVAGIAALSLFFLVGLSAFEKLPIGGDGATIWSFRALILFHLGGELDVGVLTGDNPGPAHLDYPILQPLLESTFYRTMGAEQVQRFHTALFVLYGSFAWTVGWLFRRQRFPRLVVIASAGAIALAPAAQQNLTIGYADTTVAMFAAAGALCLGIWIERRELRYALLGAVLLAAACNTKNEGQLAAIALLVSAAGVVAFSREHRWRDWAITAAVVAAGALPWIAWRHAHDIQNDDANGFFEVLDFGLVTDQLDRLGDTFGRLFTELANQGGWGWAAPTFLTLSLVCLFAGVLRPLAAFYLGAAVLVFLGLAWVYWTGNPEIGYWLSTSAARTVSGVVLIAAAGAGHLASRLIAARDGPPAAD